jgi:SAM-dependent methyltransferase
VEPETFRLLLTPTGQEALQAAGLLEPREVDFLSHYTTLCRSFPAELARVALEISVLRLEAKSKFSAAGRMYFTREALEQATDERVASYRALRFRDCPLVVDLGCSIGSDTAAFARQGRSVGIDLDHLRLSMARANLAAMGLMERAAFIQADLTDPLPVRLPPQSGLFFDPARRKAGRRIHSTHQYQPPLRMIRHWIERCPEAGVKLSPGVDLEELEEYQGEVEFISLQGELKEAVLWLGALRSARKRATILPGAFTLTDEDWDEGGRLPLSEPRAYLYEPDGAVLRAGLVQHLGAQIGASQLDPDIAYLTGDRAIETPFARYWTVEDWLPFSLKRLRAVLRERHVGQVIVKKRGSPLQPEALIRDLRLKGDQSRVVFLTHLDGKPVVVICLPEEKRD